MYIIRVFIFIFFNFSICFSVISADCGPRDVLLIGRPEQGGVNFEHAKYPVTNIKAGSAWYLDPRSQGNASITERFPCTIPSNMPQQFGIVILEKGMLNEVAITIANPSPAETMPIGSEEYKNSCFTDEDNILLKALSAERKIYWQKWTNLKPQRDDLSCQIAKEALDLNLLEESVEFGHVYYRIVGENPKVTYSPKTVSSFLIKLHDNVPRADEYQKLDEEITAEYEKMSAMDKKTDPLYKRQYEQELRISKETSSLPKTAISVAPNIVFKHIQTLLDRAWDLVSSGGFLIVFAGDAKIPETELASGISKSFLSSKSSMLEEHFFDSQAYEGEHYFSNPVLPAQWNIIGWAGGREAGSYFVIQKR